ncbi:MAG: UDP-2,3-diacylglucosamine diphosphatase LpxI [Magnetococcales bacterium]|nr:UDP-2,3-diacylglucosamine diphosphatase LpxI [Magnetococcales bacterium]
MSGSGSPRARIGLVAGNGRLPLLFARCLRAAVPCPLVIVGHVGEADPALEELADAMIWVRLGQFRRILKYLQQQRVTQVVFAGGITKSRIWSARPDTMALGLVARLRHLNDDLLLRAVATLVEEWGFQVRGVQDFCPDLLVPAGTLTRLTPDAAQWEQIRYGWRMAQALGRLDIGQAVVVRDRAVVAVEAMEGTDAMIRRAGPLAGGRGVMVKVSKPGQERRLDLPTIGPGTVQALAESGVSVLAVEAGSVLILDPETTLTAADRQQLVIVALSGLDAGSEENLVIPGEETP